MAITAVVGLPGSGKTYASTRWMMRMRRKTPNREIVSNYPIYLPGKPVRVVEGVEEMFELNDCELVFDEAHLGLGARDWVKHSGDYGIWISQLRKRHVNLTYTTQNITSVDKLLRDRTEYSYYLESWRQLGFFAWRSFFGANADQKMKFLSGWYWYNQAIADMYDTEYIVRW